MEKNNYKTMLAILREELVPALGCTEPIAIAFAAAKARDVLGEFPEKIEVECSGNIIKNAKGVIVPNTGNLRGIKASAIIGALAGHSEKKLQVLSEISPEQIKKAKELMETGLCVEKYLKSEVPLHIIVTASAKEDTVSVEVKYTHTGIVKITRNQKTIFELKDQDKGTQCLLTDRTVLSVNAIYDFANEVEIADVSDLLDQQINCNLAIAKAGLAGNYGANVGSTLLKICGDKDAKILARAYAAAGSDARMSGCVMPVVINSGSGNQGLTVSLPVFIYAKMLNVSHEKLYRALVFSNLLAIHLKTGIGRLSAYCGAVSAACGSGAAITYLYGGNFDQIEKTITNTLADISGMVCDGAKPSCAAKISSAVDAAIMGSYMAMNGQTFHNGEGLVKDTVEKTIQSIGSLARLGMRQTDKKILSLMLEN